MSISLMADLSNNNPSYIAEQYRKAGHRIIALKASEGLSFVDPTHRPRCLASGAHHIAVVHYHFARPDLDNDPGMEARHFLSTVGKLAGKWDYLAVDVERATPEGFQADPAWTRRFDAIVQAESRFFTILYANRSTLELSDKWLLNNVPRVWDADWSTAPDYHPPGYTVAFRQFTDGQVGPPPHQAAGIGVCDMNRVAPNIQKRLMARD